MKKYIPLLIIASILLSGCSIDWNDEKENKIVELEKMKEQLEKQIEQLTEKADIEKEKIELEKQKRTDTLRKECESKLDEMHDQRLKILNSCVTKDCQDKFINDPKFKISSTYVEDCISLKQ
jgi:protein involved in sex pheromone biosynthesis